MIMLIGLTFAELGTMFPVSGGVVRFPHFAFGSFASFTMGWITWLAAASMAPVEVEAALSTRTKYAAFTDVSTRERRASVHTLTALGYVVAVVLMAIFCVVNSVGIRFFARINNALVWWKLAVIVLVIVAFLVTAFHGANFTDPGASRLRQARHLRRPSRPSGSSSPTSASARDRARGRERQPASATCRSR